jgi:integrase
MASLLYGAGLRLMECVRLRVKDVDFAYYQLTVQEGKGAQDHVTMLPRALVAPLQRHLAKVKLLHEEDLLAGYGEVYLPYAFDRKDPYAATAWEWQYVFPAAKRSVDPRSGVIPPAPRVRSGRAKGSNTEPLAVGLGSPSHVAARPRRRARPARVPVC